MPSRSLLSPYLGLNRWKAIEVRDAKLLRIPFPPISLLAISVSIYRNYYISHHYDSVLRLPSGVVASEAFSYFGLYCEKQSR